MFNRNTATLANCVERARKILQFEQRTNHQDRAIKPGGIEAFIARWCEEASSICQSTGQDLAPLQRIAAHLADYHQLDPLHRATNLRAALAVLNDLDGSQSKNVQEDSAQQQPNKASESTQSTLPQPITKKRPTLAPTTQTPSDKIN